MPAHVQPVFTSVQTRFWQHIWQFFMSRNFVLYTPSTACYSNSFNDTAILFLDTPGYCEQTITSFEAGIEIAFLLRTQVVEIIRANRKELSSLLQQKQKKELADTGWKIEFLWNYLGKNEERSQYLTYLHQLFWKNQQDESLQAHPAFSSLLEEPWRLGRYTSDFDFDIYQPTEFFDDSTTTFLENLQKTMNEWTFDPYLVCSDLGSFQWQIRISSQFALSGSIWKQGKQLKQRIQFENLE